MKYKGIHVERGIFMDLKKAKKLISAVCLGVAMTIVTPMVAPNLNDTMTVEAAS